MTPKQLRETLELALAERAPKAYAAMKASEALTEYLGSLTGQALASISEAKEQIGNQAAMRKPPYNNEATVVPMLSSAFKVAESVALEQAIEMMPSEEQEIADEPKNLYDMTGDDFDLAEWWRTNSR